MNPTIKDNIYDKTLISKIKERTGPKKLKKIIKNLRNLEIENIKKFSGPKIKIFEEKDEAKETEFEIVAPIIGFHHYFEDFKKSNPKIIKNNKADYERENTPSTVDDNEEIKQVDSSDFSGDD